MTDSPHLPLVLALPREHWSHGWLALLACAPRLDPARAGEFERYLRRALRRAAKRGFRQVPLAQLPDDHEPTWEPPARVDDLDEARCALERLDPRERRVLLMRALGRGRAEIGARLGVTPTRVGQIERRAVERARG